MKLPRELLEAAIFIGALALLFILGGVVCIVGIAWTHYPHGIRRKRKKEDKA